MSANKRSEVGTEVTADGCTYRIVHFEQTQPISVLIDNDMNASHRA